MKSRRQEQLRRGRERLARVDPVMARLVEAFPDFDPHSWMEELPEMDLYGSLLFMVVGQQLSLYATRLILARITALFGDRLPSPRQLLETDPEKVRATGLSRRKVETLRDLAQRFVDGRLNDKRIREMADDEVLAALTEVPGIGPWTAQGALIIALEREDVVLPGDLALRKAARRVYGLDHVPSPDEVLAMAEAWRPYRSLAISYLFAAAFEPGYSENT